MEIIELLKAYGITGYAAIATGVAIYLFRLLKTAREEQHTEIMGLLERFFPLIQQSTDATNENTEINKKVVDAIRWCERVSERTNNVKKTT